MTAGQPPAGRAAGGRHATHIDFIPEHRYPTRLRAELARRPRRLVAASLATVITPTCYLAFGAATRTVATLPNVTPIVAATPLPQLAPPPAPVEEDPWISGARSAAATCPGLPASVLLAIGKVETGLGRSLGPSSAGARGPMQFLPATWRAYAADGDGDGDADIMSLADALHGAARLLCANGGGEPDRLRSALWNYNHSAAYVDRVLAVAGLTG